MALSAEQRRILSKIKTIGRQVGASPKEIKAAIETGLVESNLRNLPGGDADSQGWRQERASLYKDPQNLDASIKRFFGETRAVKHKYGSAGDLAAAVQRPAAQYRGRYQQQSARADQLMGSRGGPTVPGVSPRTKPIMPAAPMGPTREQILGQYLEQRGRPGALAALGGGLSELRNQQLDAKREATYANLMATPDQKVELGSKLSQSAIAEYAQRANTIDKKRLPYLWGGGHGGKVDPRKTGPLDCSGAVSAVLGINPRVSGQFTKWGKPGEGGPNDVTVYANAEHVLMRIGNRFWGTSKTNPGGGAGWIKRSDVSKQYLSRFTARHL